MQKRAERLPLDLSLGLLDLRRTRREVRVGLVCGALTKLGVHILAVAEELVVLNRGVLGARLQCLLQRSLGISAVLILLDAGQVDGAGGVKVAGGVDGGQRAAQGELGLLVVVERSSMMFIISVPR